MTELSDYERATVERIDAAEAAPESYYVRRIVAEELRHIAVEMDVAPQVRIPLGDLADKLRDRADVLDPPS